MRDLTTNSVVTVSRNLHFSTLIFTPICGSQEVLMCIAFLRNRQPLCRQSQLAGLLRNDYVTGSRRSLCKVLSLLRLHRLIPTKLPTTITWTRAAEVQEGSSPSCEAPSVEGDTSYRPSLKRRSNRWAACFVLSCSGSLHRRVRGVQRHDVYTPSASTSLVTFTQSVALIVPPLCHYILVWPLTYSERD